MKGGPFVVLAHAVRAHRYEAHHLDAAGNDNVVRPGNDALSGEVERLLGRTAFSIQGYGGNGLGKARCEDGLAADVA